MAAHKYLRDGTFLHPPTVSELPAIEVPLRTRSIYTSHDRETVHVKTFPAALVSAWRAPDGDVALVLVNISDESAKFTLLPDWPVWGLTGREPRQQLGEDGSRRLLVPVGEEWVVEMAPREAQIVEWTLE